MKEDSMSLSCGYQVTIEQKDAEGVNVISGVDLFEVSIVPAPANDQTRVLSMKGAFAARTDDPVLTLAKVRQRVKASTTRQRADERAARARMPIKTKVFEV
jgi:phage head maturation protease